MTPEEYELLSELTIVILTCERPLELERAIEYWREMPVTVHFLDGSVKACLQVGALPGAPKINYHHLPPTDGENWMENYSRRMNIASGLPDTKLSVLCGDDDFFSISGLKLAINTILNSVEVDAVVGICAQYRLSDSDLVWNLRYTDWSEGLKSQSKDVAERVLDRSGNFYLYYAFMRSEIWRSVLYQTYKFAYLHDYANEYLFNAIASAHCRVRVQRHILWFKKDWEPNSAIVGQSLRIRDADWFRDKKNQKEVKVIINHMATGISSAITDNNSSVSAKVLAKKYVAGISTFSQTAVFRKYRRKFTRKIVPMYSILPDFMKTSFNSLLSRRTRTVTGSVPQVPNRHLTRNNFFVLNSLLDELSITDISFVRDDFIIIETLLRKPREELRLRTMI